MLRRLEGQLEITGKDVTEEGVMKDAEQSNPN